MLPDFIACRLPRILLAALSAVLLLATAACGEHAVQPLSLSRELVVLVQPTPSRFFVNLRGEHHGFDADLARALAQSLGVKIRFVSVRSEDDLVRKLAQNAAHLAAFPLTQPRIEGSGFRTASPYAETTRVLVQHEDALPLTKLDELSGRTVHVLAGSPHISVLRQLRERIPDLKWIEHPDGDPLTLLQRVANQEVDLAMVESNVLSLAQNFYPQLSESMELGGAQPLRWIFPPNADPELMQKAETFVAESRRNGSLARLSDRYYGHIQRLDTNDVSAFLERLQTQLPQFKSHFHAAQRATGIDWRLIAALAYQESQWNPHATSPTGVRGMMMLTEDTADRLRVSNRLDPAQSIVAGARYLRDLKGELPPSVKEPDRTWLALAAYNIGMGHLRGARSIALGRQNDPDSWYEMKKVLPLMSRPQIAARLKSGPARGGEAVILVENTRVFYDILTRFEPPLADSSIALADTPGLRLY